MSDFLDQAARQALGPGGMRIQQAPPMPQPQPVLMTLMPRDIIAMVAAKMLTPQQGMKQIKEWFPNWPMEYLEQEDGAPF